MWRPGVAAILAAVMLLGGVAPALAQHRDRGWRDRDIHRFRQHDLARWRGGHWVHSRHNGRNGWWWTVGPDWYYYPRAVYPYPDPFTPPFASPGVPSWYYCPPAQNYYPDVATCPVPWQPVPAR
jgi:hypothetical protein